MKNEGPRMSLVVTSQIKLISNSTFERCGRLAHPGANLQPSIAAAIIPCMLVWASVDGCVNESGKICKLASCGWMWNFLTLKKVYTLWV